MKSQTTTRTPILTVAFEAKFEVFQCKLQLKNYQACTDLTDFKIDCGFSAQPCIRTCLYRWVWKKGD